MKKFRVLLAIVAMLTLTITIMGCSSSDTDGQIIIQSRLLSFRPPIFMTMPADMVLQHHILPLLPVMILFVAVMRVLLLIFPVLRMRNARKTSFFAIVAILQWVPFIP